MQNGTLLKKRKCMMLFTVKLGQAYPSIPPPRFHSQIYNSKDESIGSWRFQIHLCIPACVISSELTPQFS